MEKLREIYPLVPRVMRFLKSVGFLNNRLGGLNKLRNTSIKAENRFTLSAVRRYLQLKPVNLFVARQQER